MYLFPYAEIRCGSRIIIYGVGVAGRDFYEQLIVSGYAKVVCLADREHKIWNQSEYFKVPVVGIEDIYQYADVCDYIVISIRKKNTAEKVRLELVKFGIPNRMIVIPSNMELHEYLTYRRDKCSRGFVISTFLEEKFRNEIVGEFLLVGNGNLESYFEFLILQIKNMDKNSQIYREFLVVIQNEERALYKIILLRILICAKCLDTGLLKEYVKAVRKLDNLELRYLYLVDIALFPQFFPDCIFSEFYLEIRKSYLEMIKEFRLQIPIKHKVQKGKIVFLLFMMLGENDYENLAKSWVKKFEKEYEIYLFIADISVPNYGSTYLKSFCKSECAGGRAVYYQEKHRELFGKEINLEYIEGFTIRQRQQALLNRIFEISPEIIVDVTDERLPLSCLLVKYFPVLYIPTRGFRSSMFFTKIVVEGKKAAKYANRKTLSIKEEQMIENYMKVSVKAPQRVWNREEFGWYTPDFIIVTVGFRLDYELSENFVQEVCHWMREERDVKWLLVGVEHIGYLEKFEDLILSGQIYFAGYQTDLAGIYKCCDVYLNPLRTGGGISQITAVRNGLPVVADGTIYFDAMEILGWDNLCWSLKEQMKKIKRMKKDEKYRQLECKKMQQALMNCEQVAESDLLLKECKKMVQEWEYNYIEEGGACDII